MNYKEAGVNIEEGYKAVTQYRELAAATASGAVLNGIGSFAGMFSLKEALAAMEEPVLVSGADGVGTKLDIAFQLKKYDTVGIDCVAMCVNDILCHGARPLFFLDYLACGKLDAEVAAALVKGVAAGCRETGAVLLGGETAEMPGFYDEGKYDIAGFTVGVVDRKKIVDGKKIREGDALLGIASSGPHSSGFSLIRKVIPNLNEDFGGMPIGQALLQPTRLYVKPVLELMNEVEVRGMAHITGGGFYENVPRMFFAPPEADRVEVQKSTQSSTLILKPTQYDFSALVRDPLSPDYDGPWKVPPVFARIAYGVKHAGDSGGLFGAAAQEAGEDILRSDRNIRRLMFNTYNMGIGFVLALARENVQKAAAFLGGKGFPAWEIGRVEKSSLPARYCVLANSTPVNILVLVSGNGTNLQALIDTEKRGAFNAGKNIFGVNAVGKIAAVVSDRDGTHALERAKAAGIPAFVEAPDKRLPKAEQRRELSDRILRVCRGKDISFVVMAGFLSILSGAILKEYSGRIINIHPALLPKFGGEGMYGERVHRAVLAAGETESGCTVHFVDAGTDSGPILSQRKVPVLLGDTPETLAERVRKEEHTAIVENVIMMIRNC